MKQMYKRPGKMYKRPLFVGERFFLIMKIGEST